MNGIHDMGGMDNFGPVVREKHEPVFHAEWERIIFAHAIALLGARYFKVDEIRRATESIPPPIYVRMSYYEGWVRALIALLLEKKLVTEAELERGHAAGKPKTPAPSLPKDVAMYALFHRLPSNVDADIKPRFKAGDHIVAKNMHPTCHTRLARYVRGHRGRIEMDHGIFLLPDTNAHGGPDRPQHVYSVRFAARELWGEDAPARDAVYIDLFEEYMEPQAP